MERHRGQMERPGSFRRTAQRSARWLVAETNPAGAVFGIITVGALLAAESRVVETHLELVASVLLTMVVYWFAHSYSEVVGLRVITRGRADWGRVRWVFAHELPIVKGSVPALLAVCIAWAAGISQPTAATIGMWTAVASLVTFEVAAGLRVEAEWPELVLDGLVGIAMGLAIFALRAIVH
jgi:hypothetical protein